MGRCRQPVRDKEGLLEENFMGDKSQGASFYRGNVQLELWENTEKVTVLEQDASWTLFENAQGLGRPRHSAALTPGVSLLHLNHPAGWEPANGIHLHLAHTQKYKMDIWLKWILKRVQLAMIRECTSVAHSN